MKEQQNTTVKAFTYLSKNILQCTLFFLGIYALVLVGLSLLFFNLSAQEGARNWQRFAYDEAVYSASAIYMFVLGIVFPFMLRFLFDNGVTRHQYAQALRGSGLLFSMGLALVTGGVALVFSHFDAAGLGVGFVNLYFGYLLGWLIALGFQLRHVWTATAGILVVILLASVTTVLPGFEISGFFVFEFLDNPLVVFTFVLVFTVALAVVLPLLSRRIPLKC